MNEIKKAFYNVMYKYEICFSEWGVDTNLNAWRENKGPLTDLLRHHLNWNEQELAIVFDLSISREIERDVVDECKFGLCELVDEIGLTHEQRLDFDTALLAATAEYSKSPSENNIETIKSNVSLGKKPATSLASCVGTLALTATFATIRSLPALQMPSIRCRCKRPVCFRCIPATFWRCPTRITHGSLVTD